MSEVGDIGVAPPVEPITNSKKKTKDTKPRRKKNTNVACVHCSRCHLSCDSNRPCRRCVDKGIADSCIDAPRKRRKYLIGVPANVLPRSVQEDTVSTIHPAPQLMSPPPTQIQVSLEKQHFYNPQHIVHKSKFLSNAADTEYSMLSSMIQQDGLINKIPVDNMLYHDGETSRASSSATNLLSQLPSAVALNKEHQSLSTSNSPGERTESGLISPNGNGSTGGYTPQSTGSSTGVNIIDIPAQQYPSSFQNVYSILLGPHSKEIINSKVNLFTHHFPLVPVDPTSPGNNSLAFKRLIALDPSIKHGDLQKNNKINQIYLNKETMTFPEVKSTYSTTPDLRVSFALECSSPEITHIRSNPEWEHSLRYSTPMEIYTMINKPFSHTPGFHHLLMYLRSRFNKKDIVEMCQSMAEFRPIFIACSVTLTEEDMIFMEQCYQRTLLEYAKFLEQIGTPTCVWRRNGQISYINEEFEILTGWKREELLNKMTFIVEILDDESVRDYFKTFSSVAYKDFKGTENMKTCRILSPIKGNVINCCCMWTLKRDISGLPLMILGNFMPIL
ncbi:transcription activator of gluconeogenesis Ert1p [Monosporozyma unispora]|nr:Transcriptional regulator of nonfermentable carbon utilization [Kazachstania unispora]